MRILSVGAVFLGFTLLSAVGFSAVHQYQRGKIIKVETQESNAPSHADAPLQAEVTTYHISIQLGGKVYVCRYHSGAENDLTWIEGKEVQARVNGKVLYVKKTNGKEAKGSILSTSPAGNP